MSLISIPPPFPVFEDADGEPLRSGFVFVGEANKDPETNPITVFWNADLSQPAAQPIRTNNGFLSRAGSPSRIYSNENYSITVKDKQKNVVYTSLADNTEGEAASLSFIDVAEMRALAGRSLLEGESVTLVGGALPGDGAGGDFHWDATSTASEDAPLSVGTVVKRTDTATGRFIRTDQSELTIVMYGAVKGGGDGAAAINVGLATGNSLMVPEGRFLFNSTLKSGGSNQELYAESWNSVLYTTNTTLQFGIAVLTGHIGFKVRYLKLEGAHTDNEDAPLSSAAIGVNTNAAANGFEMVYPAFQNGRFKCEWVWFDNWNTGIANNHSDEGTMINTLHTRLRGGLSSDYGYGVTSSGSRCVYNHNVFDNRELSGIGSHTGASSAAVLVDDTKDWTVNILSGVITNPKDGSTGTIISNTETTITVTLSGGATNLWNPGDGYSIPEAGQGRHAVYLNGHSRDCVVDGNKALSFARNPYQFKAQSLLNSGKNHKIINNHAQDCNTIEGNRQATYLFDTQTPLVANGGYVTFTGNTADNCGGEQLRMEYNEHSTVRDFKCSNVFNYDSPGFNNHPIIFIHSDYTTVDEWSVDNVDGSSLVGLELQQCEKMEVDKGWTSALKAIGDHDGSANAAVLTDTTANFTPGALVGETINNVTDGSTSTVTANTQTTITGVLSGGTDDDWDVGDNYEVIGSYRAGVRFNATTGPVTNNCKVTNLLVEGTTSFGDVEDAAFTAQAENSNSHLSRFTGRQAVARLYTLDTNGDITISPADTHIRVATFGGASSDTLLNINGAVFNQQLTIVAADSAKTVLIAAGGNIKPPATITLDNADDTAQANFGINSLWLVTGNESNGS